MISGRLPMRKLSNSIWDEPMTLSNAQVKKNLMKTSPGGLSLKNSYLASPTRPWRVPRCSLRETLYSRCLASKSLTSQAMTRASCMKTYSRRYMWNWREIRSRIEGRSGVTGRRLGSRGLTPGLISEGLGFLGYCSFYILLRLIR